MKQSIAIMMYYMNCGGVENSLIELLKRIDPEAYSVDLYLFEKTGEFLKKIPYWVNIKPLEFSTFEKNYLLNLSFKEMVFKGIFKQKKYFTTTKYIIKNIIFRLFGEQAIAYRTVLGNRKYGFYDFAFDFHGYLSMTTYFLAKNITARKKYTWVHSEPIAEKINTMGKYISKYDGIFCVSDRCADKARKSMPELSQRIHVFRNFIDTEQIRQAAKIGPVLNKKNGELCLLTVGRLSIPKGYDIAIRAAKILRDKDVKFKWYFCGDGEEKENIETEIEKFHLENNIEMLGFQSNPYGYMNSCDLYVQPSRYEGYAVTIVEAALLGCKIISTDVSGAKEEIEQGANGIIVETDPQAIADKIMNNNFENTVKKLNYDNRNNIVGSMILKSALSFEEGEQFAIY